MRYHAVVVGAEVDVDVGSAEVVCAEVDDVWGVVVGGDVVAGADGAGSELSPV